MSMKKKDDIVIEEETYTSEEAIAKAIMTLSKTESPDLLTELNEKEIKILSRIVTYAKLFNVEILQDLTKNFMRLRVSTTRKGRTEILSIAKSAREEQEAKSKLKKLLTFGRI